MTDETTSRGSHHQQLHQDELPIASDLVRQLVDRSFPQFAGLPLARLGASGSSNVQFRLGDDLLVRLPRLVGGGQGIDKEHRWTQKIGVCLPVNVPDIVGVGEPAFGFSERWSVVRWLAGDLPERCDPMASVTAARSQLARELAEVVLALRCIEVAEPAMSDRQLRNYRGRSLAAHDRHFRSNLKGCRELAALDLDLDAALALWEAALTLPGAAEAGPDRWYHGDLVAENLLLSNGHLTGVLDFGGLGVGDPTVDLHGAWELFDRPAREAFRRALGVDDAEWLRGRAWALAIAVMTFSYYWATMPGRIGDRLAMAQAVLADGR